jgi:integrase
VRCGTVFTTLAPNHSPSLPAPSSAELEEFRTFLREAGRSEGTTKLYLTNVRSCYAAPGGVTSRLVSDLAPKTLRTNKAALLAFAAWREDGELIKRLKRIRLPPAQRVKPKIPLDRSGWQQMIRCVRERPGLKPAMRAALLIVCLRGLRVRDVLRLRRTDVVSALRTGHLTGEGKGRKRIEYAAGPLREALEVLADLPRWETVTDLLVSKTKQTGYARQEEAAKAFRRALATCAAGAGVDGVHPHRMRRTYATEYITRLENDPRALLKLQAHMGWSELATAAQYVDAVQKEELDALGEAMMADVAGSPPPAAPRRRG